MEIEIIPLGEMNKKNTYIDIILFKYIYNVFLNTSLY